MFLNHSHHGKDRVHGGTIQKFSLPNKKHTLSTTLSLNNQALPPPASKSETNMFAIKVTPIVIRVSSRLLARLRKFSSKRSRTNVSKNVGQEENPKDEVSGWNFRHILDQDTKQTSPPSPAIASSASSATITGKFLWTNSRISKNGHPPRLTHYCQTRTRKSQSLKPVIRMSLCWASVQTRRLQRI